MRVQSLLGAIIACSGCSTTPETSPSASASAVPDAALELAAMLHSVEADPLGVPAELHGYPDFRRIYMSPEPYRLQAADAMNADLSTRDKAPLPAFALNSSLATPDSALRAPARVDGSSFSVRAIRCSSRDPFKDSQSRASDSVSDRWFTAARATLVADGAEQGRGNERINHS
jgi:hypothetical protein